VARPGESVPRLSAAVWTMAKGLGVLPPWSVRRGCGGRKGSNLEVLAEVLLVQRGANNAPLCCRNMLKVLGGVGLRLAWEGTLTPATGVRTPLGTPAITHGYSPVAIVSASGYTGGYPEPPEVTIPGVLPFWAKGITFACTLPLVAASWSRSRSQPRLFK